MYDNKAAYSAGKCCYALLRFNRWTLTVTVTVNLKMFSNVLEHLLFCFLQHLSKNADSSVVLFLSALLLSSN